MIPISLIIVIILIVIISIILGTIYNVSTILTIFIAVLVSFGVLFYFQTVLIPGLPPLTASIISAVIFTMLGALATELIS